MMDLARLTEAGALDPNTELTFEITTNGITPFLLAASVGYLPIVSLLAENPSVKRAGTDRDGFNAVYYAAHYGHLETLRYLKSIDVPYEPSDNGTTPLHGAVKKNHFHVVEFLLAKSRMATPPADRTPKQKQANSGKLHRFNSTEEWEAQVEVDAHKADGGPTPLFSALRNGSLPMVQLLHQHGADLFAQVTMQPGKTITPFLLACKMGSVDIVQYILKAQSKQQQVPRDSRVSNSLSTCAHMAAHSGSVDLLRLLH